MVDRHEASSSVGELLRNVALRSGPAFPNFQAVFEGERIEARRGRLALVLGAGMAFACATALLGWPLLSPANPLIESWDSPAAELRTANGGAAAQDPLVSYIEVLWDASSVSGRGAR
jgi:hypothetical protein